MDVVNTREQEPLAMANAEGNERPSTCAIILTFNRLSNLKHCIATLAKQTWRPDCVLVVDNHGSDGTYEYIKPITEGDPSLTILRTSENLGSAGGFAEGMTWAVKNGYDYLWMMDDDCEPDESCLEIQLLEQANCTRQIVFPTSINQLGKSRNNPAWRGVLIPRQVVEEAGVPDKELFFSKEDTEYLQWRLLKLHRVKAKFLENAIIRYSVFDSEKRPAWKFYYQSRNSIYYRLWIQRPPKLGRYRKLLFSIIKMWFRIVVREDQKIKKSRLLLLGIAHGLRGRIGKVIDPATV